MSWQTTDHDLRLIEGIEIRARVYREGNLFRADVWPPEGHPATTTEATVEQAKAWAEAWAEEQVR